jgi:hypothetical protein
MLISDKIGSKGKKYIKDSAKHYRLTKESSICEEKRALPSMCSPNLTTVKYVQQKLTEMKGGININPQFYLVTLAPFSQQTIQQLERKSIKGRHSAFL